MVLCHTCVYKCFLPDWGLSSRLSHSALLIAPHEILVLRVCCTSVDALCVCLCLACKKSTWGSSPDDQHFPFEGGTATVERLHL